MEAHRRSVRSRIPAAAPSRARGPLDPAEFGHRRGGKVGAQASLAHRSLGKASQDRAVLLVGVLCLWHGHVSRMAAKHGVPSRRNDRHAVVRLRTMSLAARDPRVSRGIPGRATEPSGSLVCSGDERPASDLCGRGRARGDHRVHRRVPGPLISRASACKPPRSGRSSRPVWPGQPWRRWRRPSWPTASGVVRSWWSRPRSWRWAPPRSR